MTIALILSGGTGTRLGADVPKQYIKVYDRCIISYCIERLLKHEGIDKMQIVAAPQWHQTIRNCLEKYDSPKSVNNRKFQGFSQPGKTRQLSIYNGLTDILTYAQEADTVLIHDAARPMLSVQMITDCLEAMRNHDGVVPVLPMKDTVYQSIDGNNIDALVKRNEIYAGQAPEVFRLGLYYKANKALFPDKILEINGSTEPAILAGMDIVMIPGNEGNFKITTTEDLERFRRVANTQ